MSDDVKPEVIKGTQEILGKFIKKPILTEKLLRKPPFRFLHDICTAAMKETGFFSDVLNRPEYMMENIKDKEGKIAFLQKVIAAVEAANGIKLAVRPSKVVAGLEASKTNEFLQALGKALKKQQSENRKHKDPANKSKSNRSLSREKKDSKEEQPDKKHSLNKASKTPVVENGIYEDKTVEDKRKKLKERQGISPRKKVTSKVTEESTVKPIEKKETEKKIKREKISEEEKPPENFTENKNEETSKEERITKVNPEAGEGLNVPRMEEIMVNGTDGEGDQNAEVKETPQDEGSAGKRKHTGKHKNHRSSIPNIEDSAIASEAYKEDENEIDVRETEAQKKKKEPSPPSDGKISKKAREKSGVSKPLEMAKLDRNNVTPSPLSQSNSIKADANLAREKGLVSRPRTSIRPMTARPASARPAAPRIREKNDVAVAEERPVSGKVNVVNVIVDKDVENEPEDDNLISMETTNDILMDEISIPPIPVVAPDEGEHGRLVEQILEVQKELEDESKLPFSEDKITGKTEIEWDDHDSKAAKKEIEKLRVNIQSLTRFVNPLGKLLDFFQEDVDSIQRELETWKNKNSRLAIQIANEKSITEQFVEPLKIHLKEIQQSIDEQHEQINVIKANIIRNNEKIQNLLTSG